MVAICFFFNDPATTEIYTLSLHDALPILSKINIYDPDGRVEILGVENVDLLREDGKAGIFFSAHLGNWEIVSLGATQRGLPLDRVYREANNRLVEWLYQHGRAAVEGALIPKGPAGARLLLKSLDRKSVV
mgnify:CR=1 FL=1